MQNTRLTLRPTRVLILTALALVIAACNPLENKTESMSLLLVESVTGFDMAGKEAGYIQSDVLYVDPETGAQSIIADVAKANLTARTLDPSPIMGTSSFADIQLSRYTVTFYRIDGKSMPGVDVPFPFEGQISTLIKIGTSTQVALIIVREAAKQEPPLLNILQASSRAEVFTVTAQIDFYGHDLTGKAVKATGYIPITFANYGN